MFFSILGDKNKFPAFTIGAIFVLLISFWNNNHEVQKAKNPLQNRPLDTTYVKNWVVELIQEESKYTKPTNDTLNIPIYIIAGEGGGIRAGYWASNILASLDKLDNRFYRRTLGFSTVSGSSIGLGFYQALKQDSIKAENLREYTRLLSKESYLSNVSINLVFWDALQRFNPFFPNFFARVDRARALENSFSVAYQKHLKKETLENDFLKNTPTNTFNTPIFLFNTTEVETGRKAIISNVVLGNKFGDAVDIIKDYTTDFPFKTAITASARFPFVTPAGKITGKTTSKNYVDGGYFDNTGLSSALNLYFVLDSLLSNINALQLETFSAARNKVGTVAFNNAAKTRHYNLVPTIIFLKNGSDNLKENNLSWKYEFAPLVAFFNAYDRGSISRDFEVEQAIDILNKRTSNQTKAKKLPDTDEPQLSFSNHIIYKKIALTRKPNDNLPTGWVLSDTSSKKIEHYVNEIEPALINFLRPD